MLIVFKETIIFSFLSSLQCHSYARGTCKTSHSITVSKVNKAIIEYLENAAITSDFNLVAPNGTPHKEPQRDYLKLIENENRSREKHRPSNFDGQCFH